MVCFILPLAQDLFVALGLDSNGCASYGPAFQLILYEMSATWAGLAPGLFQWALKWG